MKGRQVLPDARIQLSHLLSFPLRRNDGGGIPAFAEMTARAGAAPLIIRDPKTVSPVTLSNIRMPHTGRNRNKIQPRTLIPVSLAEAGVNYPHKSL